MQCPDCAFPNRPWARRCDRCDRPLHNLGTHLAVWTLAALALSIAGFALLVPR